MWTMTLMMILFVVFDACHGRSVTPVSFTLMLVTEVFPVLFLAEVAVHVPPVSGGECTVFPFAYVSYLKVT